MFNFPCSKQIKFHENRFRAKKVTVDFVEKSSSRVSDFTFFSFRKLQEIFTKVFKQDSGFPALFCEKTFTYPHISDTYTPILIVSIDTDTNVIDRYWLIISAERYIGLALLSVGVLLKLNELNMLTDGLTCLKDQNS